MNELTIPVNWGSLGFGLNGAIPSIGDSDWCDGPDSIGAGSSRYLKRWAVWQGSGGIRVLQTAFASDITPTAGSLWWTTATVYTALSGCFDAAGYPVVAVQDSSSTIRVLTGTAEPLTAVTFTGYSPRVFFTGTLLPAGGDVLCFYLDSTGTQLLARLKSENFATEHILVSTLPSALSRLTKVDRKGVSCVLWALTKATQRSGVRQVAFVSGDYTVWPSAVKDQGKLSISFNGNLFSLATSQSVGDSGKLQIDFNGLLVSTGTFGSGIDFTKLQINFSGALQDNIVASSGSKDAGKLNIQIGSGVLATVVTSALTGTETPSQSVSVTAIYV